VSGVLIIRELEQHVKREKPEAKPKSVVGRLERARRRSKGVTSEKSGRVKAGESKEDGLPLGEYNDAFI
jgi:hypothetical protein